MGVLRLSEFGVREDVDVGVPGQESRDTDKEADAVAGEAGAGDGDASKSVVTRTWLGLRATSGIGAAPSSSSTSLSSVPLRLPDSSPWLGDEVDDSEVMYSELMLLLDASDAAAYAAANDANADAKMPNAARHLAGAYVVLLLPPLLSIVVI